MNKGKPIRARKDFTMKATTTKANTNATTTADTNAKTNTFVDLLREYEQQATTRTPQTEKAYTTALLNLATATAYSVLKKCIDVSQNKALIQVKRDIAKDTALLRNIEYAQANAYEHKYNKDGERVLTIKDKDLHKAFTDLCSQSMGEGLDLMHDAVVTILAETEKAKDRNGGTLPPAFMEQPYEVRRLNRKVWIKTVESVNGWETTTTTAIQETYKAVRRAIDQSRAVQTDPRNGYTYIADISTDPESGIDETIYRRFGKYADIGGTVTDINGKETAYTADEQTTNDMDTLVESLNLSKQQADILKLRLSGYGYKAIATYFGVRPDSITKQIKRIREKAILIGLKPATI